METISKKMPQKDLSEHSKAWQNRRIGSVPLPVYLVLATLILVTGWLQ
ncbi:malP gene product [Streptococcus pyogenes]|nr:hypothetical protein [Streptococcus pyogenes]EFM33554.1 hypothetical protein HMPREF0841_0971 [Streptococcus pyogenes ATCC 10782]SQE38759.1 malP gene product [Streptococcus pyogenes]SQF45419.1 malP gene product [Streptococcus pyogenes]SUO48016.1 malP gene product [Streptococcus pyogenes]SUO71667.1 malP gene product [Streptococcus pyogenes]